MHLIRTLKEISGQEQKITRGVEAPLEAVVQEGISEEVTFNLGRWEGWSQQKRWLDGGTRGCKKHSKCQGPEAA